MSKKETIIRNTYKLNELLHKKDIDEGTRAQFVGTCLLYLKRLAEDIEENGYKLSLQALRMSWLDLTPDEIRGRIHTTVKRAFPPKLRTEQNERLIIDSVLKSKDVANLTTKEWDDILTAITSTIFLYVVTDHTKEMDIFNLFFITFNKYIGKKDRNQAFTPDHIASFMCDVMEIGREDRVLDECCGTGSFLIHAMAGGRRDEEDAKFNPVYGIEREEKAYALAVTSMLIHGNPNPVYCLSSCFDERELIEAIHPTVFLMNPPYNAKPKTIPDKYKENWTEKERDSIEDATKGLVFVKYLSDIAKENAWKGTRAAVLLPVSTAIGTTARIKEMKASLLEDNTLDAVFSLPSELFYPGAVVQTCCMIFTLNQPHGDHETFFGYFKDDGYRKKRNMGRIEQYNEDGKSRWEGIRKEWLRLYKKKKEKAGLTVVHHVTAEDEWLCEAHMEADYTSLTREDFQKTVNDYFVHLIKNGKVNFE